MSIGAGIALIVIGAILAFAVNLPNDYVDLTTIGYIVMGAGAIVFLIGVVLLVRRRQTDTVTRTEGAGGAQVTRSTTRSSNDDLV
jgi:nitrate reductase gamma subunit